MAKYWVLGGEYENSDFEKIIEGKEQIVGPLSTREQAVDIWRTLSENKRYCALTKFSVAST